MASDGCSDNLANGLGRFEGHLTKLFGAAHIRVFHQHSVGMTQLGGKMFYNLFGASAARRRAAQNFISVPRTCGIRAAGVPCREE